MSGTEWDQCDVSNDVDGALAEQGDLFARGDDDQECRGRGDFEETCAPGGKVSFKNLGVQRAIRSNLRFHGPPANLGPRLHIYHHCQLPPDAGKSACSCNRS